MSSAQGRVQKVLDDLVARGVERGLQVAAYLDGERVVDAWAGLADASTGRPVDGDTLFCVFSCSKGVLATAIHMLADRGKLRYDDPVADYWPEFASNGKAGITIRQVPSHTMEIHPFAALSHRSALVFHNLTDELPTGITAIMPSDGRAGLLPPGTESADWEAGVFVVGKAVSEILGQPVHWTRVMPTRYFGLHEYIPRGYPVRVTTLERTLVDCLQKPELCGGISQVLRAWAGSRDLLNVKTLVAYTEQLEITVIKQRVGFLLEELGLTHPSLDLWRTSVHRGGSSKLFGTVPYAPTFSERWSLSINAPLDELQSNH